MTTDEFLASGLLEQYTMGLLDHDQAEDVAQFIKANPVVQDSYNSIQESIANIAKSYGIDPPAGAKEAIIKNMNNGPSKSAVKANWPLTLAGVAAAVFLCLSVFSLFKINDLKASLESTSASMAVLNDDCQQIKIINEFQEKQLAFYTHHATRSTGLDGAIKGKKFQAVAFYNTMSQQMAIEILEQPTLSSDKCLYLWGDIDGEMIKIGKVDANIDNGIVNFNKDMASFNVTMEDANKQIDHPDVSHLVASVNI